MGFLRSVSFIVLGGGTCALPFLNLFSSAKNIVVSASANNTNGDSALTHSIVSHPEPKRVLLESEQIKELDNCVFKSGQDEVTSQLPLGSPNYISFVCNNNGQNEEVITSKWTIWLPETLLRVGKDSLKEGQRINIKTQTTYVDSDSTDSMDLEKHLTTFESDSFSKTPIKGIWGRNLFGDDYSDVDALVYIVTIITPELKNKLLYLKLK